MRGVEAPVWGAKTEVCGRISPTLNPASKVACGVKMDVHA